MAKVSAITTAWFMALSDLKHEREVETYPAPTEGILHKTYSRVQIPTCNGGDEMISGFNHAGRNGDHNTNVDHNVIL